MDNFQNNNNLNNNENGQEQNNTQSSFSYDYAKNDTINTSGTVVEEKPKKEEKKFLQELLPLQYVQL